MRSGHQGGNVVQFQIGDVFRDEIRPRFGVMRGREFYMKDCYSFDIDEEKLKLLAQEFSIDVNKPKEQIAKELSKKKQLFCPDY